MPTRVLTTGLLAGIRPGPGARALTTFDLGLYGGADVRPVTSQPVGTGLRTPPPDAPRLLPSAIQQNPMHQVLPCQGIGDAVRVGRPANAPDTNGMYPQTGYARGQRPGLATDARHPVNGPLMPAAASNFYPFAPSPLGQPPGWKNVRPGRGPRAAGRGPRAARVLFFTRPGTSGSALGRG